MGVVEVLPGVSAGTIALLTGIYNDLISSLSRLTGIKNLARRPDDVLQSFHFLTPLAIGMAIGFTIGLFGVIEIALQFPQLFWSGVFGLLVGTVVHLIREVNLKSVLKFIPLGFLFGLPIVLLPSASVEPPLWLFVVGGIGGFTAWLLPGVSGSMVLLILGIWIPMLEAVRSFDIAKVALFVAGLAIAFAVLPRFIEKVMQRFPDAVMAFFIGLIGSTFIRVWPWQSLDGTLLLPTNIDGESQLIGVLVCFILGGFISLGLTMLARRNV